MNVTRLSAWVCCTLACATLTATALAAPSTPPVGRAVALQTPPILDGDVLGDVAWRQAPEITGFWQVRPSDGEPATQRTSVFVGFSADTLYIGVVCYDSDPSGIIVSDSRRDAALDETDSFQVIFDSFRDQQNGVVFGTNPAGIEYDGQVTREGSGQFRSGGGGFNLNWDTTWDVSATISDIGWSAEMAIPFKSLRYGAEDVQTWGVNFQRNIRRNNEIAYWSPVPRQHNLYRISEAGTLEGIDVPAQRNLNITPYALSKTSRGGELDGTNHDTEFGFDLKYSLTPSLTLDATYNTDFAQVEVDELQVNLDRFSLFLPEKRPFFLENSGQFAVGVPREIELFFSRRIGIGPSGEQLPIDGGVRVSGKVGAKTNVGLLQMRSQSLDGIAPRNDFSVVRVNRELQNRSSIGVMFVNRDGDGSITGGDDYNRTYGIDGRLGVGDDLLLSGFVAKTDTPGLSGKDHALRLGADYNAQQWSSRLYFTEVGEDFNPEVGFLARDGYRKADAFIMYRHRPDDLFGFHELRPHIAYRGFWDFDGFYESGFLHVDNHWEWRNGTEIHTGVNFTHEGVKEPFEIISGVVVQPGEYDHEDLALQLSTNQSAPLSFFIDTRFGGIFGGDRTNLSPTLRYRIGETFTSELSWNHNDIDLPVQDGSFKVNLGRLRLSYSFTPRISVQALVQYDDRDDTVATNLRFAWRRSANTGLFLVYNEIDENGIGALGSKRQEIILKYSHIIDI